MKKFKYTINESDYLNLCNDFSEILSIKTLPKEVIAIPWMHIIREHPEFLKRYQFLFSNNFVFYCFKKKVKNILLNNYNKLKWLYNYTFIYSFNDFISKFSKINSDFLFITHVLNYESINSNKDFYFEDIFNDLSKKGYSIFIAKIPHFNLSKKRLKDNNWENNYIFFTQLPLEYENLITRQIDTAKKKLDELISKQSSSSKRKILKYAKILLSEHGVRKELRLDIQMKILIEKTNPKFMVIPFEGHSFERLAFNVCKTKGKVNSIAYQHTGTFRLSNAIKQSINGYNPDYIFVCGNEAKIFFEKESNFNSEKINVLGSGRGVISISKSCIENNHEKRLKCLVLPEGIIDECEKLFRVSLECAVLLPNIKFIWRLHPLLNFNDILVGKLTMNKLPPNIEISCQDLLEDISESSWVLYRGTTTIFKAISAGLRPIYFKAEEQMTLDPLHFLTTWRLIATTSKEIATCIHTDNNNNFDEFKYFYTLSNEICERRFEKINLSLFDKIYNSKIQIL
jgi:hypothetical protein